MPLHETCKLVYANSPMGCELENLWSNAPKQEPLKLGFKVGSLLCFCLEKTVNQKAKIPLRNECGFRKAAKDGPLKKKERPTISIKGTCPIIV